MKRMTSSALLCGTVAAIFLLVPGDDAGGSAPPAAWVISAAPSTMGQVPKPQEKPFRGRLPSYMGQVGLSDAQRTKVYAIQREFHPTIKELEAKLAELRKQQMEEILKVLSPTQRGRYDKLVDNAKKRRSSK